MVTQIRDRTWVYTDPEYPGHSVHINQQFSGPAWFVVYVGDGTILSARPGGDLLDAMAVAAKFINTRRAQT
jgi:hypothetical protein